MLAEETVFAGRYRIVRRLSRGGMGAVYEARHVETDRACALKVMLPHVAESAAQRERFRLEARAAAAVSSTYVVEVLDAGVEETSGSPFLVMELLAGEDLQKRRARLGRFEAKEVAAFLMQAARGLEALHRAAIVHRDLKPSNLFLAEREGEAPHVKVLDLGVAKRIAETAGTTEAVGTPFYMAPEQLRNGRVSAATDVYALGLVAYSLLVGTEYWAAEAKHATSALALALSMLDGPQEQATARAAALGVTLPKAFDGWFAKATARDPDKRFGSAILAATELGKVLGAQTDEGVVVERVETLDTETLSTVKMGEVDEAARTRTLSLDGEVVKTNSEAGKAQTNAADLPAPKGRQRGFALALAGALGIAALAASIAFFGWRKKPPNVEAPSPTNTTNPSPETPATIEGVGCTIAEITGEGAMNQLDVALGKAACARLGVELGVPFGESAGASLLVHAERGSMDALARVTLSLGAERESAEGKSWVAAINGAIKKLSPKLKTEGFSRARIDAWGAKDEAGAYRIERALRRTALRFSPDRLAEAEAVAKTNPESPVPQVMMACAKRASGDEGGALRAKETALAKLGAVPKGRAHLLEGLLRTYVKPANAEETNRGVGLLIASYGELAEDPDFAGLYTLCGCIETDQTLPMTDWIADRWGVLGLPLLTCSFRAVKHDDATRRSRYVRWMNELPEVMGYRALDFLELGDVELARHAVDTMSALGIEGVTRAELAKVKAHVALGELDAKTARDAAEVMLGDPDGETSHEGARLRLQALLVAGKTSAALESSWLEVGRQEAMYEASRGDVIAGEALRLRRLLGHDEKEVLPLEGLRKRLSERDAGEIDRARVELLLYEARKPTSAKEKKELEALVAKAEGLSWRLARDRALAALLPYVRRVKGDQAAAALFRKLQTRDAKRDAALEAGLVFEALKAYPEAAEAYLLAMEVPWEHGFDAVAARWRYGGLRSKTNLASWDGRLREAAEAWIDAEKATRDAVPLMK